MCFCLTDGDDGPENTSYEIDNESENLTAAQEASNFMLLEVPISYTKPEFDDPKLEPTAMNVLTNVAVSPKIAGLGHHGNALILIAYAHRRRIQASHKATLAADSGTSSV